MYGSFLPLLLTMLAFSATAAEPADPALELEPCINGAVSASGAFPTQAMEEQINAYIAWSAGTGQPYYLFQAARDKLTAAYPEH